MEPTPSAITRLDDLIEQDYGGAPAATPSNPATYPPLDLDARTVAALFGWTVEEMRATTGDDVKILFHPYRITTTPETTLANLAHAIRQRLEIPELDLRIWEKKIIRLDRARRTSGSSSSPRTMDRHVAVVWLVAA